MISAFGVVHTSISKSQRRDGSGGAIAGSGAVLAGAGLLGGGIPGTRPDSDSLIRAMTPEPLKQRIPDAIRGAKGGVFGWRTQAHKKQLEHLNEKDYPTGTRKQAYLAGVQGGKVGPEKVVLRHLKRGRMLSHGLLGAGAAATGYGIYQKSKVSKSKKEEAGGALLEAGATTAGESVIGERILRGQAQRWSDRATNNLNEAHRLVPRLKPQTDPKWAYHNANKVFAGKSRKTAEQAGRLRGAAFQQQYFSDIYRGTAKAARKIRKPALATAAGGGLLLLGNKKSKVQKFAVQPVYSGTTAKGARAIARGRMRSFHAERHPGRPTGVWTTPDRGVAELYAVSGRGAKNEGMAILPRKPKGKIITWDASGTKPRYIGRDVDGTREAVYDPKELGAPLSVQGVKRSRSRGVARVLGETRKKAEIRTMKIDTLNQRHREMGVPTLPPSVERSLTRHPGAYRRSSQA